MTNFDPILILNKLIELINAVPNIGLITLALLLIYAYNGFSLYSYLIVLTLYFLSCDLGQTFWNIYTFAVAFLAIPLMRQTLVTTTIVSLIKKLGLLPKISETEKIALTSGTIWVDGELFSGKPNFKWILSQNYPSLSREEQSFLDNEVEELCRICPDYQVQREKDLPESVWKFIKEKKFFGMIIPKEYGGLGFSAYAHSCVIQKLASRSVTLAITVMVPNSLGPAELLLHYGNKEQRDHYLPRLADGRELPCFALTEPTAGSDATSITSEGVLFKDMYGETKIRLNWNKRYITLGAYATVIGVAFQLKDPNHILSDKEDLGITCALIPHDTPGVRQGRRHDPLATPFINSPLNGDSVIVGIDAVIGGQQGLGKGWKMLMECLAAGRGISLPSTSCGGSKLVARVVSSYCSIRQQFGLPVGKFEGVEEVLARIVGRTYISEAMRSFTAAAIDNGSKPAVITGIAKYHATEMFRQNINDGMDLAGGKGIIRGPKNLLANPYFSTPISITVEGANIMTRSLIHFGQGAIMCHPFAYKEITALEESDVKSFDRAFFSHIKHLIRNLTRSVLLSLSRGYLHISSRDGIVGRYECKIAWASATFALFADIAMAMFGGNLKRKEKINGRFGDILSAMYMAVCILRKFEADGSKKSDIPTLHYAMKDLLDQMQVGFEGLYQNMFGGSKNSVARLLSPSFWVMLPFAIWCRVNRFNSIANDNLGHKVVKNFIKNGAFRDSLTTGIFVPTDENEALGKLEIAMKLSEESKEISEKIKNAIRNKTLPKGRVEDLIDLALEKSVISLDELSLMKRASAAVLDAVQVDEYSLEEYKKL
ncbi:MAG: acyl-CoA dehydrogenase [Rickettsiales bacterium]|nr:acyl-CoA dehydrogenase [Rickettsiales bacterium]